MLLSGIQPFTLLDFPGKIACIFFTPGCNFRCGYCHNPEFVLPEAIKKTRCTFVAEETALAFLEKRRGLLEGVVVSGGEVTLMPDLAEFLRKVRALGFLVKLDTNGSRPEVLRALLKEGLVDYVAMDVKTSLDRYETLVGPLVNLGRIRESVDYLKTVSIPIEFRTTYLEEVHDEEAILGILDLVSGSKRYFLQTFRPGVVLNPEFLGYRPFTREKMEQTAKRFARVVEAVGIRG